MAEESDGKQTVVEEGTEIEGTVRSRCPVKVSGNIKGDVATPTLVVTTSGSVKGQVKVTELRSEGEIAGQIEAESVQLSGRVNDQTAIRAKTIEVKLAQNDGKLQVTFGNVELQVGDRPARADVDDKKAERERKKNEEKQSAAATAEKR